MSNKTEPTAPSTINLDHLNVDDILIHAGQLLALIRDYRVDPDSFIFCELTQAHRMLDLSLKPIREATIRTGGKFPTRTAAIGRLIKIVDKIHDAVNACRKPEDILRLDQSKFALDPSLDKQLESAVNLLAMVRTKLTNTTNKKRRRTAKREPKPLTLKETESLELFSMNNGNVSAAARQAGISHTGMQKRIKNANRKLGPNALRIMNKTIALPLDKRGQANISDHDAEDPNGDE